MLPAIGLLFALASPWGPDTDFKTKIAAVSSSLVGQSYAASPLGEGPGGARDRDPIFSTDRFDCVTYVESVMAAARSTRLADTVTNLQEIRYRNGEVMFAKRHHIMMAQWLPENIERGFLRDVTARVGAAATTHATLRLSPASFDATDPPLPAEIANGAWGRKLWGEHRLPIVPAGSLDRTAIGRIPDGTVMTTIRGAAANRPYRASHVGLVLQSGATLLRHADRRRGKVVTEPLESYLARTRRQTKRPVAGFHFVEILPADRLENRRATLLPRVDPG